MIWSALDLAHAVGTVSRYMSDLGKEHWELVKWLLKYLKETTSTSLLYGNGKLVLEGFRVMGF